MAAIGVFKGDVIDTVQFSVRRYHAGTPVDHLGIMCERPILSAASNLAVGGIDGHKSAAGEGPNVRLSLFIEHEIPANDASCPISQGAGERVGPFGPIGRI